MLRIAKTITVLLVIVVGVFLLNPMPIYAESSNVMNGGFLIQIGEEKKTTPLYYSINCYLKKNNTVGVESSSLEDQKGELLTYWFSEMNTCPEIPAGNVILEGNLYFNGIENYTEVGMTPDGGMTTYPATRIAGKGWTINLDLVKCPQGGRSLQWYVRHKDNRSITIIFIFKFSFKKEGMESGGVFVGLLIPTLKFNLIVENIDKLINEQDRMDALTALRGYFKGMRNAAAETDNEELVNQVLQKIKAKEQAQEKASLLIKGYPNTKIQVTHVGSTNNPYEFTLDNNGLILIPDIDSGLTIKVRYLGHNWQEIRTQSGGQQELDLKPILKYQLKLVNSTQKSFCLTIDFQNLDGTIDSTINQEFAAKTWMSWQVPVGWKVRTTDQKTKKSSEWIVIEKKQEINLGQVEFNN